MGEERFKFTDLILDQAIEIKNQRPEHNWSDVADILGCDPGHLQSTLSRRKSGKRKGRWKKSAAIEGVVTTRAKDRPTDIAHDLGITLQAVYAIFGRLGLTPALRAKMRREMTEESPASE